MKNDAIRKRASPCILNRNEWSVDVRKLQAELGGIIADEMLLLTFFFICG